MPSIAEPSARTTTWAKALKYLRVQRRCMEWNTGAARAREIPLPVRSHERKLKARCRYCRGTAGSSPGPVARPARAWRASSCGAGDKVPRDIRGVRGAFIPAASGQLRHLPRSAGTRLPHCHVCKVAGRAHFTVRAPRASREEHCCNGGRAVRNSKQMLCDLMFTWTNTKLALPRILQVCWPSKTCK